MDIFWPMNIDEKYPNIPAAFKSTMEPDPVGFIPETWGWFRSEKLRSQHINRSKEERNLMILLDIQQPSMKLSIYSWCTLLAINAGMECTVHEEERLFEI